MPSDNRDPETHRLLKLEESIVYCFDFSNERSVAGGATIASPLVQITDGASLVTLGTPEVLTSDFEDVDENGNVGDTVSIGKGVKVAVTPGSTKGQCTVSCRVTDSTTQKPVRKVIFKVE